MNVNHPNFGKTNEEIAQEIKEEKMVDLLTMKKDTGLLTFPYPRTANQIFTDRQSNTWIFNGDAWVRNIK